MLTRDSAALSEKFFGDLEIPENVILPTEHQFPISFGIVTEVVDSQNMTPKIVKDCSRKCNTKLHVIKKIAGQLVRNC